MNNLDNILAIIGNEDLLLKMSISTFEIELRNTLKLLESKKLFNESIFKFYFKLQLNLLLKTLVQDLRAKPYERELQNYYHIFPNGHIDYFKLHDFLFNLLDYYSNNTPKEIIIKKLI